MKYSFVKIACATPELYLADVDKNAEEIIKKTEECQREGAQIIVFPQLCLTGATCGDLFFQSKLISSVKSAVIRIVRSSVGNKALVFVGAPYLVEGKLYNCAFAISNGRLLAVVPKKNIPANSIDENRYFTAFDGEMSEIEDFTLNEDFIPFGDKVIFRSLDDEKFTVSVELGEDLFAVNAPSCSHALNGANIIVNLSSFNEMVGRGEALKTALKAHSSKCVCAYALANSGMGESTTDLVFSGKNIIAENGDILAENKPFTCDTVYTEADVEKITNERVSSTLFKNPMSKDYVISYFNSEEEEETTLTRKYKSAPFIPEKGEEAERSELILSIQAQALAKRMRHVRARSAVIGISGGLDSSLALLVISRAFEINGLDKKNVHAITMPGFGTTGKTFNNSLKLIDCIGATSKTVRIADSVLQHFKDIDHDREILDVTYENAQARTRTLILMDYANKVGGLVVGTGDLSELALGWCTYNGDHMSMYSVNSSIPKTLVKYLVNYEAERIGGDTESVLKDILATEISPELLPPDKEGKIAQKTEDIVGPYTLHDFYLYYAVRYKFSPSKIFFIAKSVFKGVYGEKELKKWLVNFYRRFFTQQFKRSCSPDGVKVGSVGLSPRGDYKMPSDAYASLWLKEAEGLIAED